MTSERWIDESDICFITGKIMSTEDRARFTWEFDAWISEEGQRIVEERATSTKTASMMSPTQKFKYQESQIIYKEWYALDAAAAANDEDYMDVDANNDEFRSNTSE